MPIVKQKQRMIAKNNSGRKAPGTRLGTLEDWREASGRSGKPSARHGRAVRDGR